MKEIEARARSQQSCFKKAGFKTLAKARKQARAGGLAQIPYECPHCHFWHLTSVRNRN
jgi:hypothetical protein